MTGYPPGSYGAACDALDAQLGELEARAAGLRGLPLRLWARSRRRRLAAARARMHRLTLDCLEREGWIAAGQRAALDVSAWLAAAPEFEGRDPAEGEPS